MYFQIVDEHGQQQFIQLQDVNNEQLMQLQAVSHDQLIQLASNEGQGEAESQGNIHESNNSVSFSVIHKQC